MADKQITCGHCGIQFSQSGRGRTRKYCSKACLWTGSARAKGIRPVDEVRAERKALASRQCKICGADFLPRNGSNVWACCSKACSNLAREGSIPVTQAKREFAKWANPDRVLGFRSRIEALRRMISGRSVRCSDCGSPTNGKDARKRLCDDCGDKRKKASKKESRRHSPSRRAERSRRKALKRGRIEGAERFDPLEILARDGWRCHICGCSTPKRLRGTYSDNAPELDHIIPLAQGGKHTRLNTACACRRCNIAKGSSTKGQLRLVA